MLQAKQRIEAANEQKIFCSHVMQLIYAAFVTTYVVQGYYALLYYIHYIVPHIVRNRQNIMSVMAKQFYLAAICAPSLSQFYGISIYCYGSLWLHNHHTMSC